MTATTSARRRWLLGAGALVVLLAFVGVGMAAMRDQPDVVVYNGRSQYGDERAFAAFQEQTGLSVELRGGTAPELFERLRREGDQTPADLLVTTDLANLWRAEQAGLLEPVSTEVLREHVPASLRAGDGAWWAISARIRTPMRSTERVSEGALNSYDDLGDARFRGRLCLRTSNNEYNQSLVADLIAKRGAEETERILRSWMDNDPQILGSDVDVLDAIAAGRCDVGLTNHYYLGRILADRPDFPVAPAWPAQEAAGAHANVSGIGLVRGSDNRDAAVRLMEFLTGPQAQQEIVANSEMPANPAVRPPRHIREWAGVRTDPIAVEQAGELLDDAIRLMQRVGWS